MISKVNFSTNLEEIKKDMEDVARLFPGAGSEEIHHEGKIAGENYISKITFRGESHQEHFILNRESPVLFKRTLRKFSKIQLFKILSAATSVHLPWGALTGIRPVKLFGSFEREKAGMGAKVMAEDYFVTEKKIKVLEKIFETQKPILATCANPIDLYVGIPFCPSRCHYCSFLSTLTKGDNLNGYFDFLMKDLKNALEILKENPFTLRSIYVGGGTPSVLSPGQIETLLAPLSNFNVELTFEGGRADTLTREKLEAMKRGNVTRVSINPQTAHDKTLKAIGRTHTYSDFEKIFHVAKELNFEINCDLILGLGGETLSDSRETFEKVTALSPGNITLHTLCQKAGSKYKEQQTFEGNSSAGEMLDLGYSFLEREGYFPYYLYRQKYTLSDLENVGFCKNSTHSIYNIDIMEENTSILGCGAGSVSKRHFQNDDRLERLFHPKDIETYYKKLEETCRKREELFKITD